MNKYIIVFIFLTLFSPAYAQDDFLQDYDKYVNCQKNNPFYECIQFQRNFLEKWNTKEILFKGKIKGLRNKIFDENSYYVMIEVDPNLTPIFCEDVDINNPILRILKKDDVVDVAGVLFSIERSLLMMKSCEFTINEE